MSQALEKAKQEAAAAAGLPLSMAPRLRGGNLVQLTDDARALARETGHTPEPRPRSGGGFDNGARQGAPAKPPSMDEIIRADVRRKRFGDM